MKKMAKYVVGCSPVTSKLYAGTIKDGMWGKDKKEVTDTAPAAVAQHLLQKGEKIEFEHRGGRYELKVEKI